MYHPTRGGVRGGRDQFSWDDVKVDKHRENYLGHSLKAPVGRWQKGKDLHWYAREKKSGKSAADALQEEIKRIKEEEEQAMREALGLAPKRSTRPQGNRLDKHEYNELVKRGSTAEDLGAGHAEAAYVHGLGSARAPRPWEDPTTLPLHKDEEEVLPQKEPSPLPGQSASKIVENESSEDDGSRKRKREEKKHDRHERREKHEKKHEKHREHKRHHHHDFDDRKKHRKDRERRRHDSDSD